MKIVYFQAKENLATHKFKPLKELCIDLGVQDLNSLNVDAHTNYESWDALTDMQQVIAKIIMSDIISDIKKKNGFLS